MSNRLPSRPRKHRLQKKSRGATKIRLPKGSWPKLSRAHKFTQAAVDRHVNREIRLTFKREDRSAYLLLDDKLKPVPTGANHPVSGLPLHRLDPVSQNRQVGHHLQCPGLILYFEDATLTTDAEEPQTAGNESRVNYWKPKKLLHVDVVADVAVSGAHARYATLQEKLYERLAEAGRPNPPAWLKKTTFYMTAKYRPNLHWARWQEKLWDNKRVTPVLNYYKRQYTAHFKKYA